MIIGGPWSHIMSKMTESFYTSSDSPAQTAKDIVCIQDRL